MPRLFYLPLVEPGVLLSLKAAIKTAKQNSLLDGMVSNIQNCWFMVGADRVPAGHAGYFWVLRPICCNGLYCYSTSVSSLILFPPFSQYEPIELKSHYHQNISPVFCTT